MSDLPIRKVGDELRVRDAAEAIFKGVVENVGAGGNFDLRLPDGHRVSGEREARTSRTWFFFRNETADFGLTILGPWVEDEPAPAVNEAARAEALQAAVHLAAHSEDSSARRPDAVLSAAKGFYAFLTGAA